MFEWVSQFKAETVKEDFHAAHRYAYFSYLRLKIGGKKFAVVGACWGAWANFQISSEIALVCGVNWHPSVHMQELVHQKS